MLRCFVMVSLLAFAAPREAPVPARAAATAPTGAASESDPDHPAVVVYKSPSCGCCGLWVAHMEQAGFAVETHDVTDLAAVKRDAGVPSRLWSCHTARVGGYFVEGHVPAEQLKRLLEERPAISGIAVPGMPIGSPGMEGPGAQPYRVLSVDRDGEIGVFAEVDPR